MTDYKEQYDLLIAYARARNWPLSRNHNLTVYTEVHHIIPRCMEGKDDDTNLVRLTGQEHFDAHMLLAKAYPHINGLVLAAKRVSNINGINISRDEYTLLRELASKAVSEALTGLVRTKETCEKISKARILTNGFRGKTHTLETKEIIRNLTSGKNNGMFGKKHTKEVCDNLSRIHSGKRLSEEHKAKLKESHISGYIHTDETKDKMKEIWKNRNTIMCPHCGMQSKSIGNLNRWHFDKCRKKHNE